MDKTGHGYFIRHPRTIEDLKVLHLTDAERPYRVVAEVVLSAMDYENFVTDMMVDRQFIEDRGQACRRGDIWDCLFVHRRGREDGVLVIPEDGCFVGWAAYRWA